MDASRFFARHVAGTGFDDLPAAAVEAVKTFALDSFGVAAAGSRGPFTAEWRRVLAGPPAEARVWATTRSAAGPGRCGAQRLPAPQLGI